MAGARGDYGRLVSDSQAVPRVGRCVRACHSRFQAIRVRCIKYQVKQPVTAGYQVSMNDIIHTQGQIAKQSHPLRVPI